MSPLLNNNIHPAMRHVADAIQHDSENKRNAAYYKYLFSMQFIIYNLIEDYKTTGSINTEYVVEKFVKLGLQCMDRIYALIQNQEAQTSPVTNASYSNGSELSSPTMHASLGSLTSISPAPSSLPVSSVYSDVSASLPSVPDMRLPSPGVSPTPTRMASMNNIPRSLRPVYYNQQQNENLRKAHKQRLAYVNSNRNAIDMNLRLQRRLIENAAITRSKQAALEKKTNERLKRIEAEASEKFSSKEDQEFYKSVLKYEELAEWPLAWRGRVNSNPLDRRLLRLLIQQILRYPEHPITKLMMTYQYSIYDKISPLIAKHLENLQSIKVPYVVPDDSQNNTGSSSVKVDRSEIPDGIETDVTKTSNLTDKCDLNTEDSGRNETGSDELRRTDYDMQNFSSKGQFDQTLTMEYKEGAVSNKAAENNNESDLPPDEITAKGNQAYVTSAAMKRSNFKQMLSRGASEEFDDLFENQWEYVDPSGKESVNVSPRLSGKDEAKIKQLQIKAFQQHAHDLVKDVHLFYKKTVHLFTLAYDQWNNQQAKEQLLEEIEEPYYKPLWPYILALFRVNNQSKEIQLARVMTKNIQAGPELFGVNDEVCLLECSPGDSRFQPVCEELRRISYCTCPTQKLQCLVNFSRMICNSVEELSHFKSDSIGADDLLPIICYLVNSSGSPFIWSECIALEEFIPQRILYGEEGYCLTTVQTAMGYLMTLDTDV